jgi:3-phenylpropionate/cinnamic acid dioxygenase small subunit
MNSGMSIMKEPASQSAVLSVAAFLNQYCHDIDDERYSKWVEYFEETGRYRVTTAENRKEGYPVGMVDCMGHGMMKDRILSLEKANVFEPHRYRHVIGLPQIIESNSDGVLAKTPFMLARIVAGKHAELFLTGYTEDRIVERDGRFVFSDRLVVCDSSVVDMLIVLPI